MDDRNSRDPQQTWWAPGRDRFTLAEAGEELGVAPSTLRHQLRAGRLMADKVGRDWLVSRAELERYRVEVQRGRPRDHDGRVGAERTLRALELLSAVNSVNSATRAVLSGHDEAARVTVREVADALIDWSGRGDPTAEKSG